VPDFSSALVILFAMIAIGSLTVLVIDRSGREKAWREVAAERRWNHDARHGGR
jgi:hypothetical protein